jgi:hypothetical protein
MSTPCIEYSVATFVAGSLGFSARPRNEDDPLLGETLCSHLVADGQAEKAGIGLLDAVVAVNGEYTAFLSYDACLSRLTVQARPLVVVFARPVRSSWARMARDLSAPIKTGLLEKEVKKAHVFSLGYQARQFTVSKETFSYADNGTLRQKISLDDVLRVVPNVPGSADKERVFQVVTKDKDFDLRAGTFLDKISWLHALECSKQRAFDRPLAEVAAPAARAATQINLPPPAMRLDLTPPPPAPPPMPDRGLYWMLQRSQVRVAASQLGSPDMTLPPPPAYQPLAYDFSIEKRVLGR